MICKDEKANLQAIQDTLYVINGKWKLPIIIAITNGHKRFREIERNVTGITTRMLSKELKEMEMNKLVKRTVYTDSPVLIEYSLTQYAQTLTPIVQAMIDWGKRHGKVVRNREFNECQQPFLGNG